MNKTLKYALLMGIASSTILSGDFVFAAPSSGSNQPNKDVVKSKTTKSLNKAGNLSQIAPVAHKHLNHNELKHKAFKLKDVKIKVVGNLEMNDLSFLYKDYIGQMLTSEKLVQLTDSVTQYFIEQDYLLPQIEISEHEMKHHVLHLTVKMASIHDVVILGGSSENSQVALYANKILAQKPAMVKYTQRYIALINKIPGVEAMYRLRQDDVQPKSHQMPKVDLVLITEKQKGEIFAGVDNYGVTELGKAEFSTLAELYSPTGGPDKLMFSALTSNHPNRVYGVSGAYSRIINSEGTSVSFSAEHSEDNPSKKDSVSVDDSKTNGFGLQLNHYLYLTAKQSVEAEVGVKYKDSKVYGLNSENQGAQLENDRYWLANVDLKHLFKDKTDAKTLVKLSFSQAFAGKFTNYDDSSDVPNKKFSDVKFNVYRDQELGNNFSMFGHFMAGYSGNNLPNQEKYLLGGRDFGRGYQYGTLDGNKIVAFSLEARYTKAIDNQVIDKLAPYLFYDIGSISGQDYQSNISKLQSYGGGLRFMLVKDIELGVEVAQPIKRKYTVDNQAQNEKTKFGAFINKVFKF